MSAPLFFLGLRARLGKLLVSLGFGPTIVAVQADLAGPCFDARLMSDRSFAAQLAEPDFTMSVGADLGFGASLHPGCAFDARLAEPTFAGDFADGC